MHIQKPAKEQTHSGATRVCRPGVSVIILRGLFKVRKSKLLCCICQHLHAIIIFALSVSLQMFLFLQCLQEWPSCPSSLPIQHNQIYSGLSTRLVGTICLKQTLRAPRLSLTSVHKYNLIKFNLRGVFHAVVFSTQWMKIITSVLFLMRRRLLLYIFFLSLSVL